MTAVGQIETKADEIFSTVEHMIPYSQIGTMREQILRKVTEDTYAKVVIPQVNKLMEQNLFTRVFGNDKQMFESYDYHLDLDVPAILRQTPAPTDHAKLRGNAYEWNWMRIYKSQTLMLLEHFPRVKADFEKAVNDILAMVKLRKPTEELRRVADRMIEEIDSEIRKNYQGRVSL